MKEQAIKWFCDFNNVESMNDLPWDYTFKEEDFIDYLIDVSPEEFIDFCANLIKSELSFGERDEYKNNRFC